MKLLAKRRSQYINATACTHDRETSLSFRPGLLAGAYSSFTYHRRALILKSIRVIDGSIPPMKIERVYLPATTQWANGTRTCIYDCVSPMDLSISPQRATRTRIETRANRFLRRAATYTSSLRSRASSTKNYVAHHGKRKVKPSERTAASYLVVLARENDRNVELPLIERKTPSTSDLASSLFFVPLFLIPPPPLPLPPPLSLSLSLPRASRLHRDSIIALYRGTMRRVRVTIVKRESPSDARCPGSG